MLKRGWRPLPDPPRFCFLLDSQVCLQSNRSKKTNPLEIGQRMRKPNAPTSAEQCGTDDRAQRQSSRDTDRDPGAARRSSKTRGESPLQNRKETNDDRWEICVGSKLGVMTQRAPPQVEIIGGKRGKVPIAESRVLLFLLVRCVRLSVRQVK